MAGSAWAGPSRRPLHWVGKVDLLNGRENPICRSLRQTAGASHRRATEQPGNGPARLTVQRSRFWEPSRGFQLGFFRFWEPSRRFLNRFFIFLSFSISVSFTFVFFFFVFQVYVFSFKKNVRAFTKMFKILKNVREQVCSKNVLFIHKIVLKIQKMFML